jgi:hypothetical protein
MVQPCLLPSDAEEARGGEKPAHSCWWVELLQPSSHLKISPERSLSTGLLILNSCQHPDVLSSWASVGRIFSSRGCLLGNSRLRVHE